MNENQYFILVPNGCGRYAKLRKENIFDKLIRNGLEVYDLVKHISTRSYYTPELAIEFRQFLMTFAERQGITIDEDILNNSIKPEENQDN